MKNIALKMFKFLGISSLAVIASAGLSYAQTSVTGINSTTGPSSLNSSTTDRNSSNTIEILNNQRNYSNFVADISNSGGSINNNTSVGTVSSGSSIISFNTAAMGGNSTFGSVILPDFDNGIISVSGTNSITGPNSMNTNTVNANQNNNILVRNNSEMINNVNLRARTGGMNTTNNTTVGSVQTGSVNFNVITPSNNQTATPVLDLSGIGNENVTANFGNNTTGPNSMNTNTLNANSTNNIRVENSETNQNCFQIQAESGTNNISNNTTVGNVISGDIMVSITAQ